MSRPDPVKILFICSQNKWRSLTAEKLYAGFSGYAVKSAGTEAGARVRVTAGLLGWADLIFVMETKHRDRLRQKFAIPSKSVICFHIDDDYEYMHPELIELLLVKLSAYIAMPHSPN